MYIPRHFRFEDHDEIVAFMQRYSFATLVTTDRGRPVATHIPFQVTRTGGVVVLASHFARANPQASLIEGNTNLVIFSEPHAYISPENYDSPLSVPTWNYISVHAYGEAVIIREEEKQLQMMEHLIAGYDGAYLNQWKALPIAFKSKMLKGVVAFEITVTGLQAQRKLSQNKTMAERGRIVASLENGADPVAGALAVYMKEQMRSEEGQ